MSRFNQHSKAEFSPGFRISSFDAALLLAGTLAACLAWSYTSWLSFVIAFVVGHFFLFCNVFRISRGLELAWAAVFLTLTRFTVVTGSPSWLLTVLCCLAVTAVVVAIETRKASYHGIGWKVLNPRLQEWWDGANS